jgi:hypothetical protein
MDENEFRDALNRHWAASDRNDFDVEHDIYREDAVLEYPQSRFIILRSRFGIEMCRIGPLPEMNFICGRCRSSLFPW